MLPPNGSSPYNRGGSLLHHGQERGRSRRDWSSGRLVRLPFGLSPSSALDLPRLGVNYMSRPHTYSVCPARWRRSWAYCTPKRWKWCMSACAATPPPIPCASSRKVAYVKLYSGCEIRLMSCSMRLGSIVRKGPEPFSNREVAVLSIVGTVVSVGVWVGLVSIPLTPSRAPSARGGSSCRSPSATTSPVSLRTRSRIHLPSPLMSGQVRSKSDRSPPHNPHAP